MLSARLRLLPLVLAVAAGLISIAPTAADAEDPEYVKVCDPFQGTCRFVLSSSLTEVAEEPVEGKPASAKPKSICQQAGVPQPCTDPELGNWSNSNQCYLQRVSPQPPFSDPVWAGRTDGAIWSCVATGGPDESQFAVERWIWLPGEPDTVVTDPVTLAYRAIAAMQLGEPMVRSAPGVGQVGLVNMPVWLWVEKSEKTWGPITEEASVPGLTVTATAQVKAVNWAMGDGKTVRCEGAGTAYDKSMGIKDSPDCGHRYRKTSRAETDCQYKVSAAAQWDITWQSTLGDTGQISMTQEAGTQVRIGEAIPVLVDPAGGQASAPPARNDGC